MYIYSNYLVPGGVIVIISIFSLAWFIVGLMSGRIIYVPNVYKKGRKGQNKTKGNAKSRGSIEIYVGNLSYDVTEKDLKKEFSKYGKISSVRIISNKFDGKSKGYGFVGMNSRPESRAAIEALNNEEIKGRRIIVNEARSDERRSRGKSRRR